jgi:hypothetical protein
MTEEWRTETTAILADYRRLTDELGVNTPEHVEQVLRERRELQHGSPWAEGGTTERSDPLTEDS